MGEPRNAASELIRLATPGIGTEYSWEDFADALADDFIREDRRRLIAIESTDAAGFVEGMRAYFDLGAGDPHFSVSEVVAVRGDRLALTVTRAEYPRAGAIEILSINQFDAEMSRLEKVVEFDAEQRALALEELDRMHAELTAASTDPQPPSAQRQR